MSLLDIWRQAEEVKRRLEGGFNTARENLQAWRKVVTSPQARSDYARYVVKPTVKRLVENAGKEFQAQQQAEFAPVRNIVRPYINKKINEWQNYNKAYTRAYRQYGVEGTYPLIIPQQPKVVQWAIQKIKPLSIPKAMTPLPFNIPIGKIATSFAEQPPELEAARQKLLAGKPITKHDIHASRNYLLNTAGLMSGGLSESPFRLKPEQIEQMIRDIRAQNIADAARAKEIRGVFNSDFLRKVGKLKSIVNRGLYANGDVETARRSPKIGKDINMALEHIQEMLPWVKSDDAAFQLLKEFPTLKDTRVKRTPKEEELRKIHKTVLRAWADWKKEWGTIASPRDQERMYNAWHKAVMKGTISPTAATKLGFREATNIEKEKVGKLFAPWFRSPEYIFEKMGHHKEWDALRWGEEKMNSVIGKSRTMFNKWWEMLGKDEQSSERVFRYLDGEKIKLNPNEYKVAQEARALLNVWADKLHLPKERRITNYIPHLFEEEIKRGELSPQLRKVLEWTTPQGKVDPFFLKHRLGATDYKRDLFDALEAYTYQGAKKLYLEKPMQKMAKLVDRLPEQAANYVDDFLRAYAGRPTKVEKIIEDNVFAALPNSWKNILGPRPLREVERVATTQVYRGLLGMNFTAALRNLTQGINTFSKLGAKYTALGYRHLLSDGAEELKRNHVLDDIIIAQYRNAGFRAKLRALDKALFALFELSERINRGAAYYGAKQMFLDKGLPEKEAIEAAKRVVRDTQFAYGKLHSPLIFQQPGMRSVFQLSTFPLKQAEFVGGMLRHKEWRALARYIISSLVTVWGSKKILGGIINLDYPDVLFKNLLPGLGPIPTAVVALHEAKGARGNERKYLIKKVGRQVAKMSIPAGGQISKSYIGLKAWKEGESKTATGKRRFLVKKSRANLIRAAIGGQWTFPEARAYIEAGGKPMSRSKAMFQNLSQLKPAQASAKMRFIKKQNPTLYRQIKQQAVNKALGLTPEEEKLRNKRVFDGSRARAIYQQIQKAKTPEEKATLVKKYTQAGIINKTVMQQLQMLVTEGKLQ